MKKVIAIWLVMSLILSSCGNSGVIDNEVVKSVEKKDFIVKIMEFEGNWTSSTISKAWRISWSEDIIVSSQARWKVKSIKLKEWDNTDVDWLVVELNDTIWSYWLNLQKAKNALESAKLHRQSTEIALDKSISDSELALEKAEKDLNTLKKDTEEQLRKAENDLQTVSYKDIDSKSYLDLEKMKEDLNKAKLDLQNAKTLDQVTISQFIENWKVQYRNTLTYIDDVIQNTDFLLWYTEKNKYSNDSFEMYLWVKKSSLIDEAKNQLQIVMDLRDSLWDYDLWDLTIDQIDILIWKWDDWYKKINNLLEIMEDLLNNSVTSISFTDTTLSWYKTTINGLQTTVQVWYSSFTWYKNSVKSFLDTYKDLYTSKEKAIEILEKQIVIAEESLKKAEFDTQIWLSRTKIWSEDQIKNVELAIKTAKSNLDTAKKNKVVQLKSLDNAIQSAQISHNELVKELSKLKILSPIKWTISNIMVDIWQEVSIGTPLFSIVSNNSQQVEIGINSNELQNFKIWNKVSVNYNWDELTWTILSIWTVADSNLNFKVIISVDTPTALIWGFVTVNVPIDLDSVMLPVNFVYPLTISKWYINIYSWDKIEKLNITIWSVIQDKIEILSELESWMKIIVSDVSNYDPNKHNIVMEIEKN